MYLTDWHHNETKRHHYWVVALFMLVSFAYSCIRFNNAPDARMDLHSAGYFQTNAVNTKVTKANEPAVQFGAIRAAKKALQPVEQVTSKLVVTVIKVLPKPTDISFGYSFGACVFDITPCHHIYLQVRSILI